MTITHHPDDLMLLRCAAGTLDPHLALLVGSHVDMCAHCRALTAAGEQVGGVLLADMTPVPMTGAAWEKCMAQLDAGAAPASARPAAEENGLPATLRATLKDRLAWRRLGARFTRATIYRDAAHHIFLLRGAPGADVGLHTHQGAEYTLVLQGGYTDAGGSYGPGDFAVAAPEDRHNATVDADGFCVTLTLTTAPLVFDAWWQRLAARVLRF